MVALLTILSGAFICVAGTYVSVKVRNSRTTVVDLLTIVASAHRRCLCKRHRW